MKTIAELEAAMAARGVQVVSVRAREPKGVRINVRETENRWWDKGKHHPTLHQALEEYFGADEPAPPVTGLEDLLG